MKDGCPTVSSWIFDPEATSLDVEGPEVDAAGAVAEALDPSSGITGCVCRACSLPPRMKNDDEI